MEVLRIRGGVPLDGEAEVRGAKNAALPIMAAALLVDGPVVLERVPRLGDVDTLSRVLERLGLTVGRRGLAVDRSHDVALQIETRDARPTRAPYRFVRRMRASFCVLGPLLARRGRAIVPLPGGCRLGPRPVDLHLRGLAALGADLSIVGGDVRATARRLRGAEIDLRGPAGPTVTGTANVMTAAVLAEGRTVIRGAATEPEVVDLGRFLQSLGARIEGLGGAELRIEGLPELPCQSVCYRILPDRIEAATLLVAAAITAGRVTLRGAEPQHLEAVLAALTEAGCEISIDGEQITLDGPRRPGPLRVTARAYPELPSDVQSLLVSLAAIGAGTSVIADRVFPERFAHVPELVRMGAAIRSGRGRAVVRGRRRLEGTDVAAADLRGGAALVVAGLAAGGETVVSGLTHIDRGYERLDERLRSLGARIARVGRRARADRQLAGAR